MKKIIKLAMTVLIIAAPFGVQADGQAVYDKHCKGCHVAGVGNAPKPGDAAAWEARIAKGEDAMLAVVMAGKGAMPPKGTCATCDESTLKAAINVLISQ